MRLELATAEYIGARAQQQDLAAAVPLGAGAMLVLADGLGGHEGGAEAARIVVDTFKEASVSGLFNTPGTRRQALRDTLERANARIADGADPAFGHRGMASTVVAAIVAHDELSWVSVGDSHLYVWRGGRLSKLNEDHSQAGLMVRSGKYHPNDPEVLAVRSVLVSALTGRKLEIVDLPQTTFRLQAGDVLMLASDGLNTLPDKEIEGMVGELRAHGSIKLSTALLERVRSLRIERQDNTTVAVARVLEPVRQEAAETPRRAVGDPGRAGEAPRKPSASPPAIDEHMLEVRTERITPEPAALPEQIAPEPATMPVSRPMAAALEAAGTPQAQVSEPPSAPAVSRDQPLAKPVEPPPLGSPSDAAVAKPTPVEVGATEEVPSVLEGVSAKKSPPAALLRADATGKPTLNGRPGAKLSGARVVPEGWREVEADAEPPPAPPAPASQGSATSPQRAGRQGGARVMVGLVLLWLIAGGAAFAAIAALRPEWLSGIVPGFGARDVPTMPASPASQTKPPTVEPIIAPAPVPAVRPPSNAVEGAPDAAVAPKTEPARRLGAEQPQAPPAPAAPARTPGQDAARPNGETGNPAAPAPAVATPPAAATGAAADPPLVEPERPAARPSRAP